MALSHERGRTLFRATPSGPPGEASRIARLSNGSITRSTFYVGEMTNALVTARMAFQGMIAIGANYDFEPVDETANAMFIRKTIVARAAIMTVEKAMEAVGGASFYRRMGIERLLRDVQGGLYHPYHEKRQHLFTGRLALGLDPVGD